MRAGSLELVLSETFRRRRRRGATPRTGTGGQEEGRALLPRTGLTTTPTRSRGGAARDLLAAEEAVSESRGGAEGKAEAGLRAEEAASAEEEADSVEVEEAEGGGKFFKRNEFFKIVNL